VRLAEQLAAPDLLERVVLDADHSLIEFKTPTNLIGQPATSLNKRGVNVLLIQRASSLIPSPGADTSLEAGDTLFAVGPRDTILEIAS
jgi:Trk K+ transport system NAD-binding subunit